jgi:hypothetical protein
VFLLILFQELFDKFVLRWLHVPWWFFEEKSLIYCSIIKLKILACFPLVYLSKFSFFT